MQNNENKIKSIEKVVLDFDKHKKLKMTKKGNKFYPQLLWLVQRAEA